MLYAPPQMKDTADNYFWPGAGCRTREGNTDYVAGSVYLPDTWAGTTVIVDVLGIPNAGSGGSAYGSIDLEYGLWAWDGYGALGDNSGWAQSASLDSADSMYILATYTTTDGDMSAGMWLGIKYGRQGGHASDTYGDDVWVKGFRITLL